MTIPPGKMAHRLSIPDLPGEYRQITRENNNIFSDFLPHVSSKIYTIVTHRNKIEISMTRYKICKIISVKY